MTWRQIKWAGGVATALLAIAAAIAYAAPLLAAILESGPLPIPSRSEIPQIVAQALQQYDAKIQAQQQLTNGQIQQAQRGLDFNTLSNYMNQLLLTQHEAGSKPSLSELKAIQDLKDQINIIRARLGLPPIP